MNSICPHPWRRFFANPVAARDAKIAEATPKHSDKIASNTSCNDRVAIMERSENLIP